jgi:DNA-directed RNA polymerase subunit M/transcription elongation factor TFIIS
MVSKIEFNRSISSVVKKSFHMDIESLADISRGLAENRDALINKLKSYLPASVIGDIDKIRTAEDVAKLFSEEDTVDVSDSSYFRCQKCSSRKVLVDQRQMRSADEGATTILSCKNCGHVSASRG